MAEGDRSFDSDEQIDEWIATGTLLLCCPDCGNYTIFPPLSMRSEPFQLSLAHQPTCHLSDQRALAEGRTPAHLGEKPS